VPDKYAQCQSCHCGDASSFSGSDSGSELQLSAFWAHIDDHHQLSTGWHSNAMNFKASQQGKGKFGKTETTRLHFDFDAFIHGQRGREGAGVSFIAAQNPEMMSELSGKLLER